MPPKNASTKLGAFDERRWLALFRPQQSRLLAPTQLGG
jgi:hypothetical protein